MKMRSLRNMLTTVVLLIFVGIGSVAEAQVSVGIRIGPPPAPRAVRAIPRRPGPDFVWVEGYWYPVGRRYQWHNGYWTRPPYAGARWVGPRYEDGQFYAGFWDGGRGRIEHDHRWDRSRRRDSDHGDRR
jgi:hypothetical protein